jgi:hypothetical protein
MLRLHENIHLKGGRSKLPLDHRRKRVDVFRVIKCRSALVEYISHVHQYKLPDSPTLLAATVSDMLTSVVKGPSPERCCESVPKRRRTGGPWARHDGWAAAQGDTLSEGFICGSEGVDK